MLFRSPNSDSVSRVVVKPGDPAYLQPVHSTVSLPTAFSLALSPDETEVWVACSHAPVFRLDAGTLTMLQSFTVSPNAGSGISVR